MLKCMLQAKGSNVGRHELLEFLDFVQRICPLTFRKSLTFRYGKAEKRLRDQYVADGPENPFMHAFAFWLLIQECLNHRSTSSHLPEDHETPLT